MALDKRELDERLAKYLAISERERDQGNTIANIRLEIHEVALKQEEQGSEIAAQKLRSDRHGKRIRALEQQVFSTVDPEDTGVHQVEDLRRALKERDLEIKERRDSIWWKRKKIDWAAGALGTLILMIFGTAGTIIWFFFTNWAKGK